MVSGKEDKRLKLETFRGLYSFGSLDEIPADYAQQCMNISFTSSGHIRSRDGLVNSLTLGYSGGVRRFFLMETTPLNDQETSTASSPNLLILNNSGDFYIDSAATPLLHVGGAADFAAINMGNRTYLSPNGGIGATRLHRLKVVNSATKTVRDAAGLAPAVTSGGLLAATNSSAAGLVATGVHKFAVVFETDTGFWTPPGPKVNITCTPTASKPTVFTTSAAHGMTSGESHSILGGNSAWAIANDVWHITKIDDTHFSIPLDTSTLGAVTGSFTVDGAFTPATVTADGAHKVDLTSVTLAPAGAGVIKRLILATRADENEFFFLPEKVGSFPVVPDNTTTTTTVDFEDTDLVASADYLFDLLEVIPAGAAMTKYRGRLILVGSFSGDSERALVSNIDDPETFNYVSGYVQVQSERDGNILTNCFVLRDTLYLSKFIGLFSTEDNGGNPSTWSVTTVDGAIGCYSHGASSFTVSQPAPDTGDIIVFASRTGLFLFDGVVRRPELSANIVGLWQRINFAAFHRVTITHDVWNHVIYISAPLDTATEPDTLFVVDYTDGRNADTVKWAMWQFHKAPTCIGMGFFSTDSTYALRVATIDTPKIWRLDPTAKDDDNVTIESYYAPGLLFIGAPGGGPDTGGVNVFKQLNFRAKGKANAKFMITLTDVDGAGIIYPPELILSVVPRVDLQRGINYVNEKIGIKVGIYSANGKVPTKGDFFVLDRIDVWGQQLWNSRPTV